MASRIAESSSRLFLKESACSGGGGPSHPTVPVTANIYQEHEAGGDRLVFDPDSPAVRYWSLLLLLSVMFNAFVVPLRIGFLPPDGAAPEPISPPRWRGA
jgi:hypothetical protein